MISSRIPADWESSDWARAADQFRTKPNGIDLTISSPLRAGIQLEGASISECLSQWKWNQWIPDCRGSHDVRKVLASQETRKGTPSSAEDYLLIPGTSDAFALLFKVFAEKEDVVLVPKPGYPLLEVLANLDGVQCLPYGLNDANDGWNIDKESLQSMPQNAKILLIVAPNNPTGSLPSLQEWEWIANYCQSHKLALIVDEVFADYLYQDFPTPPWREMAKRIPIARLGGLSKSVGMPQVKLSWIWFDAPLIWKDELWRAMEYVADAYLGVSALAETIAPALLSQSSRFQETLLERLHVNKEYLFQRLKQTKIHLPILQGGWYACFQIPEIDDELYCIEAMTRGVLAQPGFFFDFKEENWIVISLLPKPNDFSVGLEKLLQT